MSRTRIYFDTLCVVRGGCHNLSLSEGSPVIGEQSAKTVLGYVRSLSLIDQLICQAELIRIHLRHAEPPKLHPPISTAWRGCSCGARFILHSNRFEGIATAARRHGFRLIWRKYAWNKLVVAYLGCYVSRRLFSSLSCIFFKSPQTPLIV